MLPALWLLFVPWGRTCVAQEAPSKPAEKPAEKTASPEKTENPAQIEFLETRYRFEVNGDSRKEVHARVHINNELGVRQFARLNFDYNRSFESVEIPLVHITHPSGGTADILPSAITDNPNPAVVNAPAYQDVRVKSVRILGLAPGDLLEYRIITTVSHHPLAPDFWLDHSFDRTGVVSHEIFELDLPTSPKIRLSVNPMTPANWTEKSGEGDGVRTIYRWDVATTEAGDENAESDVAVTTFTSWLALLAKLRQRLEPKAESAGEIEKKAAELTAKLSTAEQKLRAVYDFVSQKIAGIDLPLGATGFQTRAPAEILASSHATAEDKFVLFNRLLAAFNAGSQSAFTGADGKISDRLPRPSLLSHFLVVATIPPPETPGTGCGDCENYLWLDLTVEVAPFRMVPSSLRGKGALVGGMGIWQSRDGFVCVPRDLPFLSTQDVAINARFGPDGTLTAKVKYKMRGDDELLLRVAFHQSSNDKWKDLAQLLSISDGFRGQVTRINVSDPYATKEPFTVEYEITQPKFVDWSKKPVRIPALLPQLGLPDPPAKPAPGAAASPIELGTPLEVETHMTLHLPAGTTATAPTGTSVQRDYATFTSQYSARGLTVTASRHIHFLLRQVPAERAADYNAFLRAVRNDKAQDFTLGRDLAPAPP